MSRWRSEPVYLGLDETALSGAADLVVPAAGGGWTLTSLREALRAALPPGSKHVHIHVLVTTTLCRHFVQQAPIGLRSFSELQALAAARASKLHGGKVLDWVVIADWGISRPFVCAAMPASLVQSLQHAAGELGCSVSMRSGVLTALERVMRLMPDEGFVAWTTPEGAVLAYLSSHGVRAVRCLRRQPDAPTADVVDLLAREALREGLRSNLPAKVLYVFGADVEAPIEFDGGRLRLERLQGHDLLPAAQAVDTEAAWASRLAALACAEV